MEATHLLNLKKGKKGALAKSKKDDAEDIDEEDFDDDDLLEEDDE